MIQMAAVGPREVVQAFRSIGITDVCVETPPEASRAVFDLAKQGCAIIYITEDMAEQIEETISRFRSSALPAVIPIPGPSGVTGYGMASVRANVEKAVGANILFKEEG